ncbi:hypothetical protein [Thioalkalivibrio sp.]|uniref:hypothetical protein n=1 Tax=Thioalkalivibrio sp. TaxID=2093813 RepID=UPI00356768DD
MLSRKLLAAAVAASLVVPGVAAAEYDSIQVGNLSIGGALRANYRIGDYDGTRSDFDKGGDFFLDTARINLDYASGPWLGKLEYRWYSGYNMLHTGWVGYDFENESQVQVGVNRVPFGPGAYGVSQSWFFDQHYYVGLSDDMDLGVKYTLPAGDWTWDFGYYLQDEGDWSGDTRDSARYSYDVVNESGSGYEERNQVNLRGIYSLPNVAVDTDIGFSAQYGELDSKGPQGDGDHYALSLHMVNKWDNWTLASQLTGYTFDVSADQPLGTDELVQFGAFDFPNTVAAEGYIPAVSLSYFLETPTIPWLDFVIPYAEYSAILKRESDFNDSNLAVLGAAWGRGNWYIYSEFAFSDGNEFVGGDTAFGDRLGANEDDDWLTRFNINLGYYF